MWRGFKECGCGEDGWQVMGSNERKGKLSHECFNKGV